MTSALALRQDIGKSSSVGLVMYLPIYASGADADSLEGRRAGILGWVSAPFRMGDLLQGMAQQIDDDIHLAIYDGEQPLADKLLYRRDAAPALNCASCGRYSWVAAPGRWPCSPCRRSRTDLTRVGSISLPFWAWP